MIIKKIIKSTISYVDSSNHCRVNNKMANWIDLDGGIASKVFSLSAPSQRKEEGEKGREKERELREEKTFKPSRWEFTIDGRKKRGGSARTIKGRIDDATSCAVLHGDLDGSHGGASRGVHLPDLVLSHGGPRHRPLRPDLWARLHPGMCCAVLYPSCSHLFRRFLARPLPLFRFLPSPPHPQCQPPQCHPQLVFPPPPPSSRPRLPWHRSWHRSAPHAGAPSRRRHIWHQSQCSSSADVCSRCRSLLL